MLEDGDEFVGELGPVDAELEWFGISSLKRKEEG